MREWSIKIYQLNEHGEEIPANIYSKVTYHLHESFKSRAIQSRFEVSAICELMFTAHSFHCAAVHV